MEKLKSIAIKSVIVIINAALVVGGVFFIKNHEQKKAAAEKLANDAASVADGAPVSAQDNSDAVTVVDEPIDSVTANVQTQAPIDTPANQAQVVQKTTVVAPPKPAPAPAPKPKPAATTSSSKVR